MEKSQIIANQYEEHPAKTHSGFVVLLLLFLLLVASVLAIVFGGISIDASYIALGVLLLVVGILGVVAACILCAGFKVLNPNEAAVLTLFGKYYGTIKKDGFYWVNPFCACINPGNQRTVTTNSNGMTITSGGGGKISLKTMTLNNEKQTVNDERGNPIIIDTVVIWRVTNTTKAVFNVQNYRTFLSIQCDSATRNIARRYPYDLMEEGDVAEKTLRGSSQEIADMLREDLQDRVAEAGLEILDVRIRQLSYAPEIAAAMLQRQQAEAVVAARKKIVEGAVGMVEMALEQLKQDDVVSLDEERKAQMVSNLLVVLCGSKDAQPIVNSGSIY